MPSMAPSQPGPAPIDARNAGSTAVAVSWLQSLNRLVTPTPRTVRFSQDLFCGASAIAKEFTVGSLHFTARERIYFGHDERSRKPSPKALVREEAPYFFAAR